jgi:hypothetical protein
MKATPAGPRVGEVADATYRVSYWRQRGTEDYFDRPANLEQIDMAWESEEWQLSGGTIFEALTWADDGADGWQVVEVCVEVPDALGKAVGLVRLQGYDPTADEGC